MRITRVYCPQDLELQKEIVLDERTSHHLINVLRLRVGHIVIVFNGVLNKGYKDYVGKIIKIEKKQVTFLAETALEIHKESSLKIHLGQAISKGERMDWVIQKSVELGVTDITPLITEHCNIKLDEERREKRHEHWQRVAISASEQCGRAIIPMVHAPTMLLDFLKAHDANKTLTKIILHYRNAKPLTSLLKNSHTPSSSHSIALIVGPEGGISDKELADAALHGFQIGSLGPRILRTETAPLAAISILQAELGDLGDFENSGE